MMPAAAPESQRDTSQSAKSEPMEVDALQRIVLNNAALWIGDGQMISGHLVTRGAEIERVEPGQYDGTLPAVDLNGAPLSPGLIDPFFCGGFGLSIVHDDLGDIARCYVQLGVTSFVPAIGALPCPLIKKMADNIRRAIAADDPDRAQVLGLYAEGPFMKPDCAGISSREFVMEPVSTNLEHFLDTVGDVLIMVNISPGTRSDRDAIRTLRRAGKVVSMAHSDAPSERVAECIQAGATVLGHAWNNNPGRLTDVGAPGPTLEHQALVDDRILAIHLICDGIHVHPLLMKLILQCRGMDTICLASDTLPQAGCPDGPFIWNDGRTFEKRNGACFSEDNRLAGSAMLLPDQFRQFVVLTGTTRQKAIATVTGNVARSLGLDHRIGLLAPGRQADLVAWDDELRITRVWSRGREIKPIDLP